MQSVGCRIAGVFAGEACDLAAAGTKHWEKSKIESHVNDFVRHLVIEAAYSKLGSRRAEFLSNHDVREEVLAEIHGSPEWLQYRQRLMMLLRNGADLKSPGEPVEKHGSLASNLNRLRLECGWSLDELTQQTGIEKKLVLRHVNQGKKAHPGTLAKYARAFSRQLKRDIHPIDLPGTDGSAS